MSPSTTQTKTVVKENKQKKEFPTLEEIKKAIPAECFEKDALKSISFLVLDYLILAGMYFALPLFEGTGGFIGLCVWYWLMGMFGSALFIVGHDCGHTTFSNYTWLNDLCGHIAHAPILAPYWPWQKSHRQHHQYTSHLEKDKGHPWTTEEDFFSKNFIFKHFSKLPISGLFRWNPIYTGLGLPDGSHFWPFSRLFTTTTERIQCAISGLACLFCAGVALHLNDYSIYNFIKYYYIPCLFQGFWLVIITYLQHQSETIEVYEEGSWNYVRGQLQTIDRTYGFGIDSILHHISDGHVAHHFFFTRIPHYNLMKATKAIQEVLKDYPGAYKGKTNYDFVIEYLKLNVILEYLVGRGTGVLRYPNAKTAKKAY